MSLWPTRRVPAPWRRHHERHDLLVRPKHGRGQSADVVHHHQRGIAILSVNSEVFPEMSLDRISISVPYLGAAPEEVEEAVCVRIEEAIQGIDGIKQITSTASEGMGRVMIELALGADNRKVVDDIKSNVDAITTFPTETEKPIIQELVARNQVVDVAVSGRTDEFTLKAIAETDP